MDKYSEQVREQLLGLNDEEREYWKSIRQPYSVIMELTPRCNMNCIHCYLQDTHNSDEMTYQQITDILDILCEKGILFITFTGGEILARKDFVDIYMYAKRKGFLVELFTNGYLFTDEIISVLGKFPPMLVDVSLYGSCEHTYQKITGISGAFEVVVNNCRKLIEANIRVALKSPVMAFSYQEIPAMKKIASELQIPIRFAFEILGTIDRDDKPRKYQVSLADALQYEAEDYDFEAVKSGRVYQRYQKGIFDCNIGQNSFMIDYKGNMCPCMKFRHKGVPLKKENFDCIWGDFKKYSELQAAPGYWCNKCDASGYCDVCPAECDFLYGDMEYRTEEMCKMAKARKILYEQNSLERAVSLLNNN